MNAPKMVVAVLVAVSFTVCTAQSAKLPLRTVADVPMTGRATRLDYQSFDPQTDKVIASYGLPGCEESHGLLIDGEHRLAFVACEENARLAVFDLTEKKMTAIHPTGSDPDVLAFDRGLNRLYVSAESGTLTIFDVRGRGLVKVGEDFFAPKAHSVAVDSRTHRVYLPLENVSGKPVLRIAEPVTDRQ